MAFGSRLVHFISWVFFCKKKNVAMVSELLFASIFLVEQWKAK